MEGTQTDIHLVVLIGTTLMLFFVFAIILFVFIYQRKQTANKLRLTLLETQKQRELLSISIESEEKERKRLSQELHDDVGAQLSATKMFLNSLEEDLSDGEVKTQVTDIKEMINDSLDRVRAISRLVSPSVLNKYGLEKACSSLFEQLNTVQKEVKFNFTSNIEVQNDELRDINIYRIIQEFTNNILKYSKSTLVTGSFSCVEDEIVLDLKDDGIAFNLVKALANEAQVGVGLNNINARLQSIHGKISYLHEANLNCTQIKIPL